VQGRADLVAAVLLNGVALSTSGLEEVGTLLDIAWRVRVRKMYRSMSEPVSPSQVRLMRAKRGKTRVAVLLRDIAQAVDEP
jgi:hypothetical protein